MEGVEEGAEEGVEEGEEVRVADGEEAGEDMEEGAGEAGLAVRGNQGFQDFGMVEVLTTILKDRELQVHPVVLVSGVRAVLVVVQRTIPRDPFLPGDGTHHTTPDKACQVRREALVMGVPAARAGVQGTPPWALTAGPVGCTWRAVEGPRLPPVEEVPGSASPVAMAWPGSRDTDRKVRPPSVTGGTAHFVLPINN